MQELEDSDNDKKDDDEEDSDAKNEHAIREAINSGSSASKVFAQYIVDEYSLQWQQGALKVQTGKTSLASIVLGKDQGVCEETALLGYMRADDNGRVVNQIFEPVYLNVHKPFVMCVCGTQGTGKSHTLSVVLESCLIPMEQPNLLKLDTPMTALVMHYDQSETNICEAIGIASFKSKFTKWAEKIAAIAKQREDTLQNSIGVLPPLPKVVILVSPTFYHQRKRFYGGSKLSSAFDVRPLLLPWKSLDAVQLRKLMHIDEKENQLYVSTLLSRLREYQRREKIPNFRAFMKEMTDGKHSLGVGQIGPLKQRIALLQQIIKESRDNSSLVKELEEQDKAYRRPEDFLKSGVCVIADLTDPLLSPLSTRTLYFKFCFRSFAKSMRRRHAARSSSVMRRTNILMQTEGGDSRHLLWRLRDSCGMKV